ncbi:hypothetical protein EV127DRAFT_181399 [Xylaria flabelliformis]|nr:hypothetical protein EV127DRAFT_181399 [Xylaria flabelliformis]
MMYPLNHQDPMGARNKMPANNNDDLKSGLNRRRAASSRLSCISEHQKENTPNSEDDYFCTSSQAIKTPSLEPLRHPPSHRRIKGKSRSSGDGSSISLLQLDSEQVDGSWSQGPHHQQLVISTWRCGTCGENEEQTEQYEPPYAKPFRQGPSEILEVRWQSIRWVAARQTSIRAKELIHTIPSTGFDGPRSSTSGNSPLDSPSNISRPPLGALTLGNCMPCTSRSPKSYTSGSIDWEKSWPKRKPHRRHDVSESSDREHLNHRNYADAPTTNIEDESKIEAPKHEKKDHSGYSKAQASDIKSCPELNRQSLSAAIPATSRFSVCSTTGRSFSKANDCFQPDKVPGLESPDYSQFEYSRQRWQHFPNTVSKRFRSLRDKLHRSRSSSMFSTRPEFPPPPDGKERRYRSRNSNDIWPSSGEESPIFNTPASNISPVPPAGHNANLLAASGLMMAAADIDRLTASAHEGNRPRIPGTRSLELPRPRPPSDADSSPSEGESFVADATPIVPANSSSSLLPPTGLTSPLSRSPQWPGRKNRRQPSRLSEVTTPDEINSHMQPGDSDVIRPQVFWSISEPQNKPGGFEAGRQEESSSPPPSSQSPLSDDKPNSESSLASLPEKAQSPPTLSNRSGVALERDKSVSERSSSRGQTQESDEQIKIGEEGDAREYILNRLSPTIRPPFVTSKRGPSFEQSLKAKLERLNVVAQESALFADVMERLNTGENESTMAECGSSSCHPDTWSEDQGEPGDSEPFCPPDCLYSKRGGYDSEP